MSICAAVLVVIAEARDELARGAWRPSEAERSVVGTLREALEPLAEGGRAEVSTTERLERLREGMAAVAIALASCHGPLAWFLGQCAAALGPILRWRSLPAEPGHAFHTVVPSDEQFADAEDGFARLHALLADASSWTGPSEH